MLHQAKFRVLCVLASVVLLLGAVSPVETSDRIRTILTKGGTANFGVRDLDLPTLRSFYDKRSYQPAWSGNATAEHNARIALETLFHADSEGLDPSSYHVHEVVLRARRTTAEGAAEYDLLLSDGMLRFVRDMRLGRPDLRDLDRDVALPATDFDAGGALGEALQSDRLQEFLDTLDPRFPEFVHLKQALARYRKIASGGGWPKIEEPIQGPLDIPSPRIDQLRKRLAIEGQGIKTDAGGDLTKALEEFQRHHGLAPDGRVGKKTIEALNVSAAERADQIAANMERWRWLPRDLGQRYIAVNAADATLVVVEGGQIVLSSRVIVGKPKTRTAIFSATVTALTVNPEWHIPTPIARNEILPKARRDPGYLAHLKIVVDSGGALRQLPGPDNSLGLLKLEMPNRFNAYLHDTPSRALFARDERHLSHGCIRVEKIQPLASFALTDDAARGLERIRSQIGNGVTGRISLDNPLPVFVLYWTATANEDGSVDFLPDVYGRDRRLLAAVAGKPRFEQVTLNAGDCRKS
jgi:murein L,D-transpeptidase YcbB/YkuD